MKRLLCSSQGSRVEDCEWGRCLLGLGSAERGKPGRLLLLELRWDTQLLGPLLLRPELLWLSEDLLLWLEPKLLLRRPLSRQLRWQSLGESSEGSRALLLLLLLGDGSESKLNLGSGCSGSSRSSGSGSWGGRPGWLGSLDDWGWLREARDCWWLGCTGLLGLGGGSSRAGGLA